MSPIHPYIQHIHHLLADVAAMAAFVCGISSYSRCHCRMAAANTVFPAAKSAKPPSSRRQPP